MTSPAAPTADPVVITSRGPRLSSIRPTTTPEIAETTTPPENAAVITASGQPVSREISGAATMSA
jgi:hypothetical protein